MNVETGLCVLYISLLRRDEKQRDVEGSRVSLGRVKLSSLFLSWKRSVRGWKISNYFWNSNYLFFLIETHGSASLFSNLFGRIIKQENRRKWLKSCFYSALLDLPCYTFCHCESMPYGNARRIKVTRKGWKGRMQKNRDYKECAFLEFYQLMPAIPGSCNSTFHTDIEHCFWFWTFKYALSGLFLNPLYWQKNSEG